MARGRSTLEALTRATRGGLEVRSPAVGWWHGHPPAGPLVPGEPIGSLESLGRRHLLVLPEGVTGTVTGPLPRERRVAVEYGDRLFTLAVGTTEVDAAASATGVHDEQLGEGLWPVRAPTDGVFYRRPSPHADPFVEVGGRVRPGQPVGVVEAMKTFNHIVYGGAGAPAEGEIVEIRCEDAAEVHAGQVLMVVR